MIAQFTSFDCHVCQILLGCVFDADVNHLPPFDFPQIIFQIFEEFQFDLVFAKILPIIKSHLLAVRMDHLVAHTEKLQPSITGVTIPNERAWGCRSAF